MNIVAGKARNVSLAELPDSGIRPTSGRSRKALFDSFSPFDNKGVLDLFSGSGAVALESASRGAAWAVMVENDPAHTACIKENCRKVSAAGCTADLIIAEYDVLSFPRYKNLLPARPDIVFADPPYDVSHEYFRKLSAMEEFRAFLSGSLIIWEIPDTPGAAGRFLEAEFPGEYSFRKFGSTLFLTGVIR